MWPECVCDFEGFAPQEEVSKAVKKTVELARQVGGEGFEDMQEGEVRELVEEQAMPLNNNELLEIVKKSDNENEEESVAEASHPQALTLENLGQAMRLTEQLKQFFYDIDPLIVMALKVMVEIENRLCFRI
ncbi:hypothetical protein Pcinc_018489 [Petrolisthes cinctipes]|uniref:Uncharacterized protein n=1 Tax=Petrolisthes cinctipes TaxID=88211 RepID=A0AAE1FS02_PETCI|nr:hypothetical protein Pcinc_018489 [Petrolisthes cinctipes]